MERECGFYWVDIEIGAKVAYWNGIYWTVTGESFHYQDNNFTSTDEKQIKRK